MVLGPKGPGRVGRRRFLIRYRVLARVARSSRQVPCRRPVSVFATILIVVAVLLLLVFVGGIVAARRRARQTAPQYARHLAEADHALEQARASDRGWDRGVMEEVAREALAREHPGAQFDRLDLVLVDDRPGVTEDRAHFEASNADRQVPVILSRGESGWTAERVG